MEVWQSTKTVNYLRMLYPGKWESNRNDLWFGEKFTVKKINGKLIRLDTGEKIPEPKIKKRSHFISTILHEKYGGEWKKNEERVQWRSKDHDFYVYQGTCLNKRVYRRSDTSEIVFSPNGRKY